MYNLGSFYTPTGVRFFQNCYHGDASSAHFLPQGRRSQTRPNAFHIPQVLIPSRQLSHWVIQIPAEARLPVFPASLRNHVSSCPASCPVRMRSSYLVLIAPSGSLLKPLQTSISSPFSHVCEFFLYELESSSNLQPACHPPFQNSMLEETKCLEAELGEINQDRGWSGLLTTSNVSTVKPLWVVGLQGVQSKGAGRGLY